MREVNTAFSAPYVWSDFDAFAFWLKGRGYRDASSERYAYLVAEVCNETGCTPDELTEEIAARYDDADSKAEKVAVLRYLDFRRQLRQSPRPLYVTAVNRSVLERFREWAESPGEDMDQFCAALDRLCRRRKWNLYDRTVPNGQMPGPKDVAVLFDAFRRERLWDECDAGSPVRRPPDAVEGADATC